MSPAVCVGTTGLPGVVVDDVMMSQLRPRIIAVNPRAAQLGRLQPWWVGRKGGERGRGGGGPRRPLVKIRRCGILYGGREQRLVPVQWSGMWNVEGRMDGRGPQHLACCKNYDKPFEPAGRRGGVGIFQILKVRGGAGCALDRDRGGR